MLKLIIAFTLLTTTLPAQIPTGDRYHWVVTNYREKIHNIPVVGTLKEVPSKEVRKYRKWFRQNPTKYFYLNEFDGFSIAVWVKKDKVIFTKK